MHKPETFFAARLFIFFAASAYVRFFAMRFSNETTDQSALFISLENSFAAVSVLFVFFLAAILFNSEPIPLPKLSQL